MNRDDDPQLWELLGKSPAPQASPFFARNVVRQVRPQQVPRASFFSLRWLIPAAGLAAVAIAGVLSFHQSPLRQSSNTAAVIAKADLDDDVAADVDDLVGADDDDADDASANIR